MKKLSKIYQNLNYILISLLIIFAIPKTVFSNDDLFIIQGNNFTDSNVIISLLENIPENLLKMKDLQEQINLAYGQ